MKILSVKKRNVLVRFLGIEHWNITVRLKNGATKTYSVWAGCPELGHPYEVSSALYSLEEKSGEDVFYQFVKGIKPEGIGRLYLAFGETPPQNAGGGVGNIVIGVQQNQGQVQTQTRSAAQIQASLRQQTSTRVGVGVRQGK